MVRGGAGRDVVAVVTVVVFDPLRDKSYRATTLGRDVLADLALIEGRG